MIRVSSYLVTRDIPLYNDLPFSSLERLTPSSTHGMFRHCSTNSSYNDHLLLDILNTTYFRVTRGQRINFGPIMCIYIRHFEAINDPGRQFWLVNKNHFNAISFFVFMSMCKQQSLLLSSWSLKKVQQHFHFSGSTLFQYIFYVRKISKLKWDFSDCVCGTCWMLEKKKGIIST